MLGGFRGFSLGLVVASLLGPMAMKSTHAGQPFPPLTTCIQRSLSLPPTSRIAHLSSYSLSSHVPFSPPPDATGYHGTLELLPPFSEVLRMDEGDGIRSDSDPRKKPSEDEMIIHSNQTLSLKGLSTCK